MDFLTDNNPKNLAIFSENESFQKMASNASKTASEVSELSNVAFADNAKREFPINTAENTLMSYAYFKSANNKDTKIEARINDAIEIFDLRKEAWDIDDQLKREEATIIEDNFALIDEVNGKKAGYYPIDTEFNVEESASALFEDRNLMPQLEYRTACYQLSKRANELGITDRIPATILEMGADRNGDVDRLLAGLDKRAAVLEEVDEVDAELCREIKKYIKQAHDDGDTHAIVHWLDSIHEFDVEHGFHQKAAFFENPYALYFTGDDRSELEKLASATVLIVKESGDCCKIPHFEFTKNLTKIANTFYDGEEQELLQKLAKSISATEITRELNDWSDENKSELLQHVLNLAD